MQESARRAISESAPGDFNLAAWPGQAPCVSPAVSDLIEDSLAPSTRRAYAADLAAWQRWCDITRNTALPAEPEAVAEYLAEKSRMRNQEGHAVYSPATLGRWVAGINQAHKIIGAEPPGSHRVVEATLAGIRRRARRPARRVNALTLDLLQRTLTEITTRTWPAGVIGCRDRLILILGVGAALRRSELVGLNIRDVTHVSGEGIRLRLRHSKTDQEGRGEVLPIPVGTELTTCAPCAWVTWVRLLDSTTRAEAMATIFNQDLDRHICTNPPSADNGASDTSVDLPLLRPMRSDARILDRRLSGAAVAAVVKRRVAAVGLDPARFSGHSLRAGFVTQALRNGADFAEIMPQTRHTTPRTLMIYARENDPLRGNAVRNLGL